MNPDDDNSSSTCVPVITNEDDNTRLSVVQAVDSRLNYSDGEIERIPICDDANMSPPWRKLPQLSRQAVSRVEDTRGTDTGERRT